MGAWFMSDQPEFCEIKKYENGKVKSKCHYRNGTKNGIRAVKRNVFLEEEFYENGQLKSEVHYTSRSFKKERETHYYENGELHTEDLYEYENKGEILCSKEVYRGMQSEVGEYKKPYWTCGHKNNKKDGYETCYSERGEINSQNIWENGECVEELSEEEFIEF